MNRGWRFALIEAALTCGVALWVGVLFATLLFVILYPKMGIDSIGFAVIFGFPIGVAVGFWLHSFGDWHSK